MSDRKPKAKTVDKITERKPTATINDNYKSLPISWRIGNIDFDSRWGLKAIKGQVKFNYSETILDEVIKSDNEEVNKKLTSLNGRSFDDVHTFMTSFHRGLTAAVPNNVTCSIIKDLFHSFFWQEILPKIQTVEKASWHSIENATHGKGKSNSHFVSVDDLPRPVQNRLSEIGFGEYDRIYSLRIGSGEFRIYGFREFNCLNIIWIDPDHEVWFGGNKPLSQ
jgi:hypothetical protein